MKKKIARLAVCIAVLMLLSAAAFAATPTTTGFYDLGKASGMTLAVDADNPGKLNISAANTVQGKSYLVLLADGNGLPTASDTIYYIDQRTADSATTEFAVYPTVGASDDTMTVFVTSNDTDFVTKSASVKYFVSSFKLGDVNGNGSVEAKDASIVLQTVVGKRTLDNIGAADVNKNGSVEAKDASIILQAVVGKRTLE